MLHFPFVPAAFAVLLGMAPTMRGGEGSMTKAGYAMRAVFDPHSGVAEAGLSPRPMAGPVCAVLPNQTVTRVDLAEAVYKQVGLSRKESAGLVEMVLAEITEKLALGETVKLSSFGSFLVRDKGERVGRNPKTGVEVPIMQRRVIVFKPSNVLKARMNGDAIPDDEL